MTSKDKEFCYGEGIFRKYNKITGEFTVEKCAICNAAIFGSFTKYAHQKAKTEAHKFAHNVAEEKANKVKVDRYLDYYIYVYRIEFTKLYEDLYTDYRVEHLRNFLKNADLEICDWHKRDRNTIEDCKHIFEPDRCINCGFMKFEFFYNACPNNTV